MPTVQEQLFEDFVHFAARQGSGAVYQRDPHQPVPPGCVFVRFQSRWRRWQRALISWWH
jgi:hypothetical protein